MARGPATVPGSALGLGLAPAREERQPAGRASASVSASAPARAGVLTGPGAARGSVSVSVTVRATAPKVLGTEAARGSASVSVPGLVPARGSAPAAVPALAPAAARLHETVPNGGPHPGTLPSGDSPSPACKRRLPPPKRPSCASFSWPPKGGPRGRASRVLGNGLNCTSKGGSLRALRHRIVT